MDKKLVITIIVFLIIADLTVFSVIGIFKLKISDIENEFSQQLQTTDILDGKRGQTTDTQTIDHEDYQKSAENN